MPKWLKWAGGALVVLLVIGALIGEDPDKSPSGEDSAAAAPKKDEAPAPQPVAFEITSHDDEQTVHKAKVVLRGTADRDAQVFLNADEITVNQAGRWRKTVEVDLGSSNSFSFEAKRPGSEAVYETIRLTRKRTAAERAAFRERQRIKREKAAAERRARIAARVANFKASAATIPYKQLEKNADAHEGEKVKYYGKIFQIQEDSYGGGIMLVSVTDEGYGFWTDNIWVNYDGSVKGAEEDMVTIYGTVVGSRSYETQIGGETYVPEIDARYIEE